ncbi:MAG: asparagine synthase (glutamine-hydrolyzing) [Candidatus Rokubacteria bacterium]|nr:asparagine synthase (glutamine-hydrolyzing) [Candidatus Rokubacteria bacterium]
MSGLVGICHAYGLAVDPSLLERMSGAMAHRGPDGEGRWVSGPVGLAHRLLYTTPESLHEEQPVVDSQGTCRLVWDGRLDNREELIAALKAERRPLSGQTDPELTLEAYRQWGAGALGRIIGEFAFALWDGRRGRLLCARDRLGLKPLHYTWDGVTLLISSETKPILAVLDRMPEPDDEMILAFLLREFREGDHARTFFRGIHRLPPGHLLVLEEGRLWIERYWAVDPPRETRYARDEEYAEHFRSLFTEAVRCRTRSDFPIGAFVSGGLDSSAIVCTAARVFADGGAVSPSLDAFTLFSDHPDSDERRYVRAVGRASGVKVHEIHASDDDPLYRLDDLLWSVESPIVAANRQSGLASLESVDAWGCRVLLSGDGGDQLLDEIGYLADLLRTLKPGRFIRETGELARWYGGQPWEFAQLALASLLPSRLKYWGKRAARRAPPSWIRPHLAREVGLRERIREPRVRLPFPSCVQADTHVSVTGAYYVLKVEVDERAVARWGMELRYPFLDSRLVEFVLSIPWERRTRDGERKWILRRSMQGIVPDTIRSRQGKGDWTDPMDRNLTALCRRDPPAPLEDRSGRMGRYVDLERAHELVTRYLRGERELRWEVWFLVSVDRWLEKFWGRC